MTALITSQGSETTASHAAENPFFPLALKKIGLMEYESALDLQRTFHQEIADSSRPNTLILLEHPPVFTAGRRTLDSEMPTDGSRVITVDRGG